MIKEMLFIMRLSGKASDPPTVSSNAPSAGPAAREVSLNPVYTLLYRSRLSAGTIDGMSARLAGEYKLATADVTTATTTPVKTTLLIGTKRSIVAAARQTTAAVASSRRSRVRLSNLSSQEVEEIPTRTMVKPAAAFTQPTLLLPPALLTAHVITMV